jgi:L-ribulose-5-phosphate 3-epimerase
MSQRIGFMQGRLSPVIGGRIQAFPWSSWADEFPLAQRSGFRLMEWTLDQDRLYESPLLTLEGQAEIRALSERHEVAIPSLTGDCFMQAPFWKVSGAERRRLQRDFCAIASGCAAVGISIIVVPLVDNGRLDSAAQQDALIDFLRGEAGFLRENRLKVAFECDFPPAELGGFIDLLDPAQFGVNYDIGNSASLGFDPNAELNAYGRRVLNVHIKDRMLNGTTVPLGSGNADFDAVFIALGRLHYAGNYVLQTARATDGNHAAALNRYRDMAARWIRIHGA